VKVDDDVRNEHRRAGAADLVRGGRDYDVLDADIGVDVTMIREILGENGEEEEDQ
jgi:hypothetical protein